MISYAQNGEDVVLARGFAEQTHGFYVDVGACDATKHSVTKHFYDRGWRGLNLEPDAELFAAIAAQRPHDRNLQLAVGRTRETRTLYTFAGTGWSTFVREVAEAHGRAYTEQRVETAPLREILGDERIDFMKIDVEGAEAEVLASIDFARTRPRVLLIEAVLPDGTRAHLPSLPGYVETLFDGLNRFFVAEEERVLIERLSYPACVRDAFIPHAVHAALHSLSDRLFAAERRIDALANENDALTQERLQAYVDDICETPPRPPR